MAVGCEEALLDFDVEKPEGMNDDVICNRDWLISEWMMMIDVICSRDWLIDWLIGKDRIESLVFHVSIDP